MASMIFLVKQAEDEEKVIYRFGPDERKMGLIEMNKIKESVKELEPVQVDGVSPSFFFNRAAQWLVRCLFREGGKFPERTIVET
ncbi:hypothetical protein HUB98_22465 [Paenibacillus barcinonensis]|uniref:Uncharacterized protein n=1 Tax=Paenibacillus barcinonensis TaxID=198119 RepID=A0A2V4V7W0_PAEBA|nr:hypothetical protein [Paenibacillus barcinonensis]PYE48596.1 hypothetical protein DFQ00_108188 [Paenibacillus barcinonensis]QKS58713.1 hypothetical protein HUB98_22465 [Paenibacillus barcinonensis]